MQVMRQPRMDFGEWTSAGAAVGPASFLAWSAAFLGPLCMAAAASFLFLSTCRGGLAEVLSCYL